MKFKAIFGAILFGVCQYSYAGCVGPVVNGRCLTGTNVPTYGDDDSSGYESNTGTRYEYDLSDPGDSIDYSLDLDAQRRDQMSVNPRRDLDRHSGQYGGGVYDGY